MVLAKPNRSFPSWAPLLVVAAAASKCSGSYVNSEQPSAIDDMFRPLPGTEGSVEDARCDVESVEVANAQQVRPCS